MAEKYTVQMGNLIVKFGQKNLLDFFEDRFWPSLDYTITKKSGEVYKYEFLDISLEGIDNEIFLAGRLMKRQVLKARQVYSNQTLQESAREIPSDVTTLFFLRLFDHKIFVIPEQPRSPKLSTFQYVFGKLLDFQFKDLKKSKSDEFLASKGRKRFKNKEQREEFEKQFKTENPPHKVIINPIGSKVEVSNILNNFSKVKKLRLEYHQTNNEDYELEEELVRLFGESVQETNSSVAVQEYRNNAEGLEKEKVKSFIEASAESGGNCKYEIVGESAQGEKITRTDENSKAQCSIEIEDRENFRDVYRTVKAKVNNYIRRGIISFSSISNSQAVKQKAREILNNLNINEEE